MSHPGNPIEQPLYAVMTRSNRPRDNSVLARRKPPCDRGCGFWTEDDPDEIWIMDRQTAEEVVGKLALNNPQIVRAAKLVARIKAQRDALRAHDKPEDTDGLEP